MSSVSDVTQRETYTRVSILGGKTKPDLCDFIYSFMCSIFNFLAGIASYRVGIYLGAGPEGLPGLRAGLLELEKLPPDSAAEAAGSTAGWAGGSTVASAQPGESEPDHWPWAPLAAASCGWETPSCGGGRRQRIITGRKWCLN